MCIPLWQFFIAVRDFKRSVREVKENLADIKSILNGTLSMSHELEQVSAEFKNLTQFYSCESKNALRDQLYSAMSTHAHEALYHRDFFKHFKVTFEYEVNKLIEDHDKKTAQLAILDIIQYMKRLIKEWMDNFTNDKLKARLLVELTLHLQESFSQYICDGEDVWPNHNSKRRRTNIKSFCEKQYAIQTLECLLAEHFNRDITEPHDFTINYSKVHDIVYRRRASRIRRFRQYLASKIKIKKMGDYYREEISLQLSVDLKRASRELWRHEDILRRQCSDIVQGLKALPRHRFVDVLAEENVANIGQKIAELTLKSFLPEPANIYGGKLRPVNLKIKSIFPKSKRREVCPKKPAYQKESTTNESSTNLFSRGEELNAENNSQLGEYHDQDYLRATGDCGGVISRTKINCKEETTEKEGMQLVNCHDLKELNGIEYQLLMSMMATIPDVLCENNREIDTKLNRAPYNAYISESSTVHSGNVESNILKRNSGVLTLKSDGQVNAARMGKPLTERNQIALKDFLKERIVCTMKEIKIRDIFSKENLIYLIQRHQQISKLNKAVSNSSIASNLTTELQASRDLSTLTHGRSNINGECIFIDPHLIYNDIEHIIRSILKVVGRKSARYTIELIDRSHIMPSKIIDFLSNIHALYQYDLPDEKCCKNIFLNNVIETIASDLKEEEVNVLKNIIFAFTNNRQNKIEFLKKLEEKLPATLLKNLEIRGKRIKHKQNSSPGTSASQ